ncbi:MAG: aldehyde ferredoxin oxidoreductase N-terminal domain-containing protein, partial [Chloroflexota bacterium]
MTEHDPIKRDPATPGGVHGHALVVDLDRASARREPIPAEWWPEVIGGAGLATRLLNTHCPPGADPVGP